MGEPGGGGSISGQEDFVMVKVLGGVDIEVDMDVEVIIPRLGSTGNMICRFLTEKTHMAGW